MRIAKISMRAGLGILILAILLGCIYFLASRLESERTYGNENLTRLQTICQQQARGLIQTDRFLSNPKATAYYNPELEKCFVEVTSIKANGSDWESDDDIAEGANGKAVLHAAIYGNGSSTQYSYWDYMPVNGEKSMDEISADKFTAAKKMLMGTE